MLGYIGHFIDLLLNRGLAIDRSFLSLVFLYARGRPEKETRHYDDFVLSFVSFHRRVRSETQTRNSQRGP